MITLLDIRKAVIDVINNAVKDTQFSNSEASAGDLSEPIIRPSFKVGVETSRNGKLNSRCREKTLTIRIYFFASDFRRYNLENIKMQDIIESAFLEGLYVKGAYIPVDEVASDVSDTVLICSFDLYMVELLDGNDSSELMETLEYKGAKND